MLNRILEPILSGFFARVEEQLELLVDHIKRVTLGILAFRLALFLVGLGSVFCLTALFFQLSRFEDLAFPSLITGLVGWVTGMIVALVGSRLFRS